VPCLVLRLIHARQISARVAVVVETAEAATLGDVNFLERRRSTAEAATPRRRSAM